MLENHEIIIIIGVFFTSIISSVIGMGGGMILMALYTYLLPIKIAMILHGGTQLFANGFRARIHRKKIDYKIVKYYLFGSLIISIFLKYINFVPKKEIVYFFLGLFPFFAFIKKISTFFDINRQYRPFFCGILVTMAQLLAGASGSISDIFFINSKLNRFQIIGTKAITQTIGHLIKLVYYVSILENFKELNTISIFLIPLIILSSYCGTHLGKKILEGLSDVYFKKISRYIIISFAISLIAKSIIL